VFSGNLLEQLRNGRNFSFVTVSLEDISYLGVDSDELYTFAVGFDCVDKLRVYNSVKENIFTYFD